MVSVDNSIVHSHELLFQTSNMRTDVLKTLDYISEVLDCENGRRLFTTPPAPTKSCPASALTWQMLSYQLNLSRALAQSLLGQISAPQPLSSHRQKSPAPLKPGVLKCFPPRKQHRRFVGQLRTETRSRVRWRSWMNLLRIHRSLLLPAPSVASKLGHKTRQARRLLGLTQALSKTLPQCTRMIWTGTSKLHVLSAPSANCIQCST